VLQNAGAFINPGLISPKHIVNKVAENQLKLFKLVLAILLQEKQTFVACRKQIRHFACGFLKTFDIFERVLATVSKIDKSFYLENAFLTVQA
jgi:hypothetical protein